MTDNRSEVLVERRDSNGWKLVSVQHVQLAPTDVFQFFTNVYNLERITPSFLNSSRLDRTARGGNNHQLHATSSPNTGVLAYSDHGMSPTASVRRHATQRIGPFKAWRHLHEFVPTENGTEIRALVTFDLYCRSLVRTPILGWVNNDIRHIFKFRQNQIAAYLTDRTIKQLTDRRENSMLR